MANVEQIERPRAKPPEPPPSTAPHVIRAMNMVSARLAEEGVSKSRNNQQQGYKFRGIDEVLNALAGIIASERLIIIPHIQQRELAERQTKSGGALFSVTVQATYTFISATDGSEMTVGPFYGEAMDSADKATNKAMSAAYKYMAIQTFCIPTEGDNDADATTHDVAPTPERQKVRNPETGRMIDPSSAHQQRKNGSWEGFESKVHGFIKANDLDGLEAFWSDGDTQARISMWNDEWQRRAAEKYEHAQETIMNAGRP